ncbi:hypothetical protein Sjap_024619 [Stephania japonica]|uniref:Uncharacterized protein n=1 Tax=Stephania japonica TaxID=461633 RepID=A0AAP0EIK5_9MAGN
MRTSTEAHVIDVETRSGNALSCVRIGGTGYLNLCEGSRGHWTSGMSALSTILTRLTHNEPGCSTRIVIDDLYA